MWWQLKTAWKSFQHLLFVYALTIHIAEGEKFFFPFYVCFFSLFLLFIFLLFHASFIPSPPQTKNEKEISDVDLSAAWISNIGTFIMYYGKGECFELYWIHKQGRLCTKSWKKSREMNEEFHFLCVCFVFFNFHCFFPLPKEKTLFTSKVKLNNWERSDIMFDVKLFPQNWKDFASFFFISLSRCIIFHNLNLC